MSRNRRSPLGADRGARVGVFPEGFAWPWFLREAGDPRAALAQTVPGRAIERLQEVAWRRGGGSRRSARDHRVRRATGGAVFRPGTILAFPYLVFVFARMVVG